MSRYGKLLLQSNLHRALSPKNALNFVNGINSFEVNWHSQKTNYYHQMRTFSKMGGAEPNTKLNPMQKSRKNRFSLTLEDTKTENRDETEDFEDEKVFAQEEFEIQTRQRTQKVISHPELNPQHPDYLYSIFLSDKLTKAFQKHHEKRHAQEMYYFLKEVIEFKLLIDTIPQELHFETKNKKTADKFIEAIYNKFIKEHDDVQIIEINISGDVRNAYTHTHKYKFYEEYGLHLKREYFNYACEGVSALIKHEMTQFVESDTYKKLMKTHKEEIEGQMTVKLQRGFQFKHTDNDKSVTHIRGAIKRFSMNVIREIKKENKKEKKNIHNKKEKIIK
eukprot:434067_1